MEGLKEWKNYQQRGLSQELLERNQLNLTHTSPWDPMGGIPGCCELADVLARLLSVIVHGVWGRSPVTGEMQMLHLSSRKFGRMVQNFPGPGKYLTFIVLIKMIKRDVEDGYFTCHWHSININTYADSEDRFFWKIKEMQEDVLRRNLKAPSVLPPSAEFPNM